ncbi:hypothetical protein CC2G_003318 [Coprinopsis cinerea AmutBmut pab1-1]|nr:hypothetical protein CC2G_003318 [Coprinopsis cinerea AmutBmut pab1-1]
MWMSHGGDGPATYRQNRGLRLTTCDHLRPDHPRRQYVARRLRRTAKTKSLAAVGPSTAQWPHEIHRPFLCSLRLTGNAFQGRLSKGSPSDSWLKPDYSKVAGPDRTRSHPILSPRYR